MNIKNFNIEWAEEIITRDELIIQDENTWKILRCSTGDFHPFYCDREECKCTAFETTKDEILKLVKDAIKSYGSVLVIVNNHGSYLRCNIRSKILESLQKRKKPLPPLFPPSFL